ncbi:phage minor head protein [Avibacterium avium]|uniref:phage head morphogenesis protein n=1 Tax=Avibacterium avium TaxID=751 RepID=UPI003BF7A7EB
MWLFPAAIEREYVKYLCGVAKQITDKVREKLPEIEPHLKKQLRQDDFTLIAEQWLAELLQATTFFTRESEIRPYVRQYLTQTAEFNKKQFHKVLKSAYKVDIFLTEPWLDEPLLQAEWQNINLIKSIPTQLQEKLRYRMAEAVLGGESHRSLAADLEKLLDIPKRRATLIARDQIGKLNGRLTQLRQENIGVKSYIWRGSLDERERLLHVEREGKEFRWDNPPDDGHPGQPILCRCSAEAVLPEFGELESVVGAELPLSYMMWQKQINEPKEIREINQKSWSFEFKEKAKKLYNRFADNGIILDIHAIARLGERLNQLGLSIDEAIAFILSTKPNYIDERKDRLVIFDAKRKIAVIQSKADGKIITFEKKATPSPNWKSL